ncbi:hypothetical protein [Methylobacillus sp. Pita1]|uniref:hypothetical protein n=1 Tax=Methylobacillus sp. Pita1 TaxID=3382642 RepID=UPI0038B489D5
MNFAHLVCLPDLLQPSRSAYEGIFDLIREPIRQGCGASIGYPPGGKKTHGLLPRFDLQRFEDLASQGKLSAPDMLWAKTFHHMPIPAMEYLFANLPENSLLLSYDIPPWLRRACISRNIHFLDIRQSPLGFGRDIHIALDTNHTVLRERLASLAITNEELRLEASLLSANLRSHRARLNEGMRHTFQLDGTLIYVSQPPKDITLLNEEGNFQNPDDFSEQLQTLSTDRELLFMIDYFGPYLSTFANQQRNALARLLGKPVRACPQSTYQILSAYDDIELVGISAAMLQEAAWFDKKAHWLGQPFTPLTVSAPTQDTGYFQVHFQDILAPAFWHQVLAPEAPTPRLPRLPQLDRHFGRETLDEWREYEKVLNWERPLPWRAFERSGGIVLRNRINALEKMQVSVPQTIAEEHGAEDGMQKRIRQLKDTKRGQTAYILGNAATLMTLDIDALMNLESFWFNKAFALEEQGFSFRPKYYFLRDPIGLHKWTREVMNIEAGIKFFSRETYSLVEKTWPEEYLQQDIIALDVSQTPGNCMFESDDHFSYDPSKIIYSGYTSVLDAVQIAYYMGYERVLLGGVELDYSQPYFYGETVPSRNGVQDWLSECTRKSFLVARKHFEKNGRILAKITPSPHLPLEYINAPEIQR